MNHRVDEASPANAGILAFLRAAHDVEEGMPIDLAPEDVTQPYLTLGTHPDVVERLWDKITELLPESCRWVVYGYPTLVHPETGVIFGFAQGVPTYALRLPEKERLEALAAGAPRVFVYASKARLDMADFGEEWVLGHWLAAEPGWCLAAYEYAGQVEPIWSIATGSIGSRYGC